MPFKRKDSPYFWISYSVAGKRIRESSGTTVRKDALSIETKKRHEQHQYERFGKEPVRTFDELFVEYLIDHDLGRVEYAARVLFKHFTGKTLNDLTKSDIGDYIRSRKVKDGTIRRELEVFRAAINWAKDKKGWDIPNPVYLPPKPEARLRWLTKAEYLKLVECATGHVKQFIILGVNTGMRHGEILNLTWDRVDLNGGMIYFQPEDAKSGKFQSIPANNTVRTLLEAIGGRTGHVITYRGAKIGSVKKGFKRAVERAGLDPKEITPHITRHTFASWLVQKSIPIKTVQELMRHADIQATLIYSHLSPDNARDGVKALEEL